MINAVLVFNNNGQPRLTKFYTQLVRRNTQHALHPSIRRKAANTFPRIQQYNNA
jgi:sensor domain CHASE-containing protein